MSKDDDVLADEVKAFERAYSAEAKNREIARDDLRFARLGEQWPEKIEKQRNTDKRPCLTINKMPAFVRQVVNDARQNKPQIKIKGVDDKADAKTADIISGLIRNIEYTSKADIAYDTAVEYAAYMGFGFVRVVIDYEHDDTFDKCIRIERVSNPFSVYGDPDATCADGSSWNRAFVTESLTEAQFEAKYKGAEKVDWKMGDYAQLSAPWRDEDGGVIVCESWLREEVDKKIVKLSNGVVVEADIYDQERDSFEAQGLTVVGERTTKTHKVTQRIMSGAEILETNEWAGKFIPIVPFYGEEFNVEGERHFRSLIHNAKDSQRMFNYWRSTATELVALAPRVPWIGPKQAFDADKNWDTANTENHAYLMYGGSVAPQRLPLDSGPAAGALQEAMTASDDMKAILGIYDASLGQRSNETSGKAINARKAEGDVSTFHIIDNEARSIRHTGCIVLDLVPHVYSGERVVRIIGDDGKESSAKLGEVPSDQAQQMSEQQMGQQAMPDGSPMPPNVQKEMERQADLSRIYDISVGKYDVAVDSGPSFTTRREETAMQMTEMVRSFPQAAPIILPQIAKQMDWHNADAIAEQLEKLNPAGEGKLPPEAEQQMKQMDEALKAKDEEIQKATQTLQQKDTLLAQQKITLAEKDLEIYRMKVVDEIQGAIEAGAAQNQQIHDDTKSLHEQHSQQEQSDKQEKASADLASIGPVIAEAIVKAFEAMPPLQVNMPAASKMKRTPFRDRNGVITHTVDEPIMEEAQDAGMLQ